MDYIVIAVNKTQRNFILKQAQAKCQSLGLRLTEKRQGVLEILLQTVEPLSAYELTDKYNKSTNSPILAMSVYRILEFLESVNLAHRIHSANKYIACKSLDGACHHHLSVLLVCKSCHQIEEIDSVQEAAKHLFKAVESTGFSAANARLELPGLCNLCKAKLDK
ncbi:Fur family transcriptional regulator [Pseudoalteromonas sp. PS5]|uniref:Fur family transcriptional regulator n=1 Tax=Pseudoalteromonas sp. PS5 TaxID=1437473 RepID=UPI001F4FB953|nr:Fur family transcriptional regulator [Pseudoalteromonas sp. PS5]